MSRPPNMGLLDTPRSCAGSAPLPCQVLKKRCFMICSEQRTLLVVRLLSSNCWCLQGMEYLHSKRIVHFDLKSANLLLGYKDRRAICKVADFGLSKQKRDTYVSNVSSQRGTLPWIAPEIIKTPHAVTEKVRVVSVASPLAAGLAAMKVTRVRKALLHSYTESGDYTSFLCAVKRVDELQH